MRPHPLRPLVGVKSIAKGRTEMAYRCQSCGHFAGLDDPELNYQEPEFDGDSVTLAVSASYPSACCGDEVATAEYEALGTLNEEFPHATGCKGVAEEEKTGQPPDFDLEVGDVEATDRYQDTDPK